MDRSPDSPTRIDAYQVEPVPAATDDPVPPTTAGSAPRTTMASRAPAARRISPFGGLPALDHEIRDLLYARLRVIGVLAVVGWALLLFLFAAFSDAIEDKLLNNQTVGRTGLTLMVFAAVVCASVELFLVFRRDLSLRWLRRLELLIFGASGVCLIWIRYATLREAIVGEASQNSIPVQASFVGYASVFSDLTWMICITIYGVFVPNTWRRTLCVACGMALAVLCSDAITWSVHWDARDLELWRRAATPAVLNFLTLFMSVATAVFGSFKIRSLQEAAHEAQQQMRDLGQYHLKKLLGVGGMGEVYLAEHRLLKRPCAVKLIRPERAGDPAALARFEREVQATARLRHPNTVEVYDYGHTDDGTFYYVMEYLDGIGLDELVKRHGPLPPGRVLYLARQICGALHEAHGQGLIHRDIKPGNVLVCRQAGLHDVAKLVDFGLVQTLNEDPQSSKLTHDGQIVGTPDYMSPEQVSNPRSLDHRTDIYSLGGLVYFMLTGRPPFLRNSAIESLIAHQRDAVEPLRAVNFNVPADVEAVVLRCLAKNASERYADATSLESAIVECGDAAAWTEANAAAWWKTQLDSA